MFKKKLTQCRSVGYVVTDEMFNIIRDEYRKLAKNYWNRNDWTGKGIFRKFSKSIRSYRKMIYVQSRGIPG